jgi:hypothetical protein
MTTWVMQVGAKTIAMLPLITLIMVGTIGDGMQVLAGVGTIGDGTVGVTTGAGTIGDIMILSGVLDGATTGVGTTGVGAGMSAGVGTIGLGTDLTIMDIMVIITTITEDDMLITIPEEELIMAGLHQV